MDYFKPASKKELLRTISGSSFDKSKDLLLAGGTDIVVQMEHFGLEPKKLLDIKGIKSLKGIRKTGNTIHIGTLTTVTELLESKIIAKNAPLLRQAAFSFAATQIRNRSTIGGNLCNASPAGDLIPPLYALEAKLRLESAKGNRNVHIQSFFIGPGKTILKRGELLTEISFKALEKDENNFFYKLGQREAMAIAVISIAGRYKLVNGKFKNARIALGAVAPTVIRAAKTEKWLNGSEKTELILKKAGKMASEECSPISDVRGSSEYRRLMVEKLLSDLLLI